MPDANLELVAAIAFQMMQFPGECDATVLKER
jgi:hypothetical protein